MTDFGETTSLLYLTFTCRIRTNEFGYTKELTDDSHQKLHDTISKLKKEGLGYRRISKKLNEMYNGGLMSGNSTPDGGYIVLNYEYFQSGRIDRLIKTDSKGNTIPQSEWE